jgi:hypothetical protein
MLQELHPDKVHLLRTIDNVHVHSEERRRIQHRHRIYIELWVKHRRQIHVVYHHSTQCECAATILKPRLCL